MNSKEDLDKFLSSPPSSYNIYYYCSELLNFNYSNLSIDYNNDNDKKLVNKLFSRIVHFLYHKLRSSDGLYIYTLSELNYLFNKIRKSVERIFEIDIAVKDCEPKKKLDIKVVCNNNVKYYCYSSSNFLVIKDIDFEATKTENESKPILQLKEMEFVNE